MTVENIRNLYKASVSYVNNKYIEFDLDKKELSKEFKRRIKRLENDYNRLMRINTLLCETSFPKTHFDESTGIRSILYNGGMFSYKINPADPHVPVKLVGSTSTNFYSAGEPNTSEGVEELQMEMENTLEQYYYSAFRITKIVQELTGRKNYHCHEITIVRNKLIEHPEAGSIYSFGYGTNGPQVKPICRGEKEWNDAGLVHNTAALVKSILNILGN